MIILVVAAHPDDEVLGCGGTIARASEEHEIRVLVLGEGMTSRMDREQADSRVLERLRADATEAARLLGARAIEFEALPDNRFDQVPLLDIVKIVERQIERLKPDVCYTHHSGDLNIDHGLTFRAVMTATRPGADHHVREVLSFEVPSSTEWAFHCVEPSFRPNVFVDVSGTIEKKIAAMSCYSTEIRPLPHPRSPEALRATAARWGSVIGVDCAEAFELIRCLR